MFEFYLPHIDKEMCLSWRVEIAPCQAACPLSIDVEGYITAVAEGNFKRALQIIREKCPLPSVCGRVCHHPCEIECKRGKVDEPLAIRALKRFVTDHSDRQRPNPAGSTKREKVAIIGSGPTGLTAAYDLVVQGYGITIYEAQPVAGGMLAFGIPEFDLPQEIVQGEIDYLRALGVEIRTNTPIGESLTIANLFQQGYKAVLMAIGAQSSAPLAIPGTNFAGVIYAMPLLRRAKFGEECRLRGKVLVIGGGNVAIDAARTARRLGATEVHLITTRERKTMPAFAWLIDLAEAEGILLHNCLVPEEIRSRDGKRVSQLGLRRVLHSERDRDGKVTRILDQSPDAKSTMEADWVMIAIGQAFDLSCLSDSKINMSNKGTIIVDPDTLETNRDGIFAAGDVVDGPGTVVQSMAAGRRVAASIANYLQGKNLKNNKPAAQPMNTGMDVLPQIVSPTKRQPMQSLPPEQRVQSFQEVELGFTKEQAMQEAKRCLKCKTCNLCLEETHCVAFLPVDHEGKKSPLVRGNICGGCGRCARSCPYHNIHLT